MKTSDFEVKTRGLTMLKPMSKVEEIFQVAGDLLQQEIKDNVSLKLRLLGQCT